MKILRPTSWVVMVCLTAVSTASAVDITLVLFPQCNGINVLSQGQTLKGKFRGDLANLISSVNIVGGAGITTTLGNKVVNGSNSTCDVTFSAGASATPGERTISIYVSGSMIRSLPLQVILTPKLVSLSIDNTIAGGPQLSLNVIGSGFSKNSVVKWNDSSRTTTFINSEQLSAVINATDIKVAGTAFISVFTNNFCVLNTNKLGFTIKNPIPAISSFFPDSITTTNGSTVKLTINGSGFTPGVLSTIVSWNGINRTKTFINPEKIDVIIPASDIVLSGRAMVTVTNSSPGGGQANREIVIKNPKPVVIALSLTSLVAGGGPYSVQVLGSGFVGGSVVLWNGSPRTTSLSADKKNLVFSPTLADNEVAGTASVSVSNAGPGGGVSNAINISMVNGKPFVQTYSPSSLNFTVGSPAFTMTFNGFQFIPGTYVAINGSPRPTNVMSSTKITTTIETADLINPGALQIQVINPAPGGGAGFSASAAVVNPNPNITTLEPANFTRTSGGFTLTVKGTGFISTSKIQWSGTNITTSFVSNTEIKATISADLATHGINEIRVFNPSPGGGLSNMLNFFVD